MTSSVRPALVHLRASDVSVLLEARGDRSPAILHWGDDLGPLSGADAEAIADASVHTVPNNGADEPVRVAILPQLADAWTGHPGICGARADGSFFSPRLTVTGLTVPPGRTDGALHETGAGAAVWTLEDPATRIRVELTVELLPSGLVRERAQLTNTGDDDYVLQGLTLTLPASPDADEILDLAGRWGKERVPQRSAFGVGAHVRENRRGRTGADSAYVLHTGPAGFDFASGEIRAVHTAFSGNHVHRAERLWTGDQVIGGGELLLAGEGCLAPGASYQSPWVMGAYGIGLDAVAARFHRHLRSRDHHVSLNRPVTLNVWEAVYFDHDLDRLKDLADRAASLGVERYVLDDGWFGSRRDDHSGLGDWVVSAEVWPDGLAPLADHVTDLGMQFGLWFEPEMVNEDSDVARAHPEWIMAPGPDRLPVRSRHQQVLNLSIPEAYAHVRDQMAAVLESTDISYIKWDHNRDLIESGTRATGAAAVSAQTRAAYRLMDELKERFPGLEIESCSSGGARVDLGVLERTDRVWVSDCIDPLERQQMNRWTAQLIPLELMGSHIASGRSHTTGRLHSLAFRAATALFGHLGIEWDLAQATDEEIIELREWISAYKRLRELLFTGTLVRVDRADTSLQIQGVVADDQSHAVFSLAALSSSALSPRGSLRLRGLDNARRYRVRLLAPSGDPHILEAPAWWPLASRPEGLVLPGSALTLTGLATPNLAPEQAFLLELEAVAS